MGNPIQRQHLTEKIKEKAYSLGFEFIGIAKSKSLDEDAKKLETWLNKNLHAGMQYMENHFEKRINPEKLAPGTKTIISLGLNYYSDNIQTDTKVPKVSKYAYGRDYHKVLKQKMKTLWSFIENEVGDISGRYFVDSAPILDRAWAREAGIGWTGKNTMLISKSMGSYFFLGEMLLDIELEYDGPIKDYCGTCRKCIDACPTDAILPERQINSNKCISYLTIELKEDIIDDNLSKKFDNWAYGCDICQEVCPWNSFSKQHTEDDFVPKTNWNEMTTKEWYNLTEEDYNLKFEGSAIKRAGYKGLKRNLKAIKKFYQKPQE